MTQKSLVLIVDDEPAIVDSLQELLAGSYETQGVFDAASAWTALEQRDFSLVLLDVRLGKDHGEALLAKIRQRWPSLPVLMVSGQDDASLALLCLKLGAVDYVPKPWKNEYLLALIAKIISKKHS